MDLTPLLDAVSVTTLLAGLVAIGAIKMGPQVAKYAINKIIAFFR